MAGHANLPFRLVLREMGGVGLVTTEMLNARSLVEGGQKTRYLAETSPEDRPIAGQIYGLVPEELAAAAQWLEGHGFDAVDINMGCPARKLVRKGHCVAVMKEPDRAVALVSAAVNAVHIPVTVKMRLGWDVEHITAPLLASEFETLGVAGVTVHGRTRGQFYEGEVDLDGIRAVVEAVDHIPVIGNGDVCSANDAARMFRLTGCAGIAIGRAAMLNPFIFVELKQWGETGDPGQPSAYEQRIAVMERQFQLLLEIKGEHHACHMIRKFAKYYRKLLKLPRPLYLQLVVTPSPEDFAEKMTMVREHVKTIVDG